MTPAYEGLVTRALAFALDALVITAVAVVVGAAFGLSLSVITLPNTIETILLALAAAASVVWSAVYFVAFWSTTGQTPGNRVLGIRVCDAEDASVIRPLRALARLAALTLAAIPLLTGFLPILFDDRRRGLHDMLAGTIVVGTRDDEPLVTERARRPPRPTRRAPRGPVQPHP